MKTKLSIAMAVLSVAAAGLSQAQDPTVKISASENRVTLQRGEFQDFASTYLLSNGRHIKFVNYARRYYARLDGADYTEIYPVDKAVFVTDAGARMAFRDQGEEVTISNYETLPTAGVAGRDITLLAHR